MADSNFFKKPVIDQFVDFDVEGANWVSVTTFGSPYEEELDVSRAHGHYRHRLRAVGPDDPHLPWQRGRAPDKQQGA